MPITKQQIEKAQAQQHAAAHDPNPQVRLIAGPGSGKSHTIQERVSWLLSNGVQSQDIYVVSFTRASALDLRNRVRGYCKERGQDEIGRVSVSTLHSLALRALRAAGLLTYPADPLVMDDWELEKVFDAEFEIASGHKPGRAGVGYPLSRCQEIRRDYEAYCGTGRWNPPSLIPPDPPISEAERARYRSFHITRTQTYSCVLPGEIVRQCIENMASGTFDPGHLLGIQHLIVDEYQDLNPSDLEFVDRLIASGAAVFVAGDDDQSIYSFRFASPEGIQTFKTRFPGEGYHELTDCFRCTTGILSAAQSLIASFPNPNRIPKNLTSLYASAEPPEPGMVCRWRFASAVQEARAIACSCNDLVGAGISPREILILISNTRAQLSTVIEALKAIDVKYESPREETFLDTNPGRFLLAILRVVCEPNDYVAHRLILGLRPRVGPSTCNGIAETVVAANLNYRDIFYQLLPPGLFSGRQLSALTDARAICAEISTWEASDTLAARSASIIEFVSGIYGPLMAQEWLDLVSPLPPDITLEELRDYLWANTDEQQASLLKAAYERLGLAVPADGFLPQKVRIMTMHGAKGLSGSIAFIPGLMEEILPGQRRQPYPGLVLESARMLYVSITRARAACILSYARTRVAYGQFSNQTSSRFLPHLNGPFVDRADGLAEVEINRIAEACRNL